MASVQRHAPVHGVPVVRFAKGDRKEEIARPYLQAAAAEGGAGRVALIGIAQEKAPECRSWKARGQEHLPHPHMEWGRQMAFVNHFYFHLWDPEWGAAFWKTNAYAVPDLDLARRPHLGAAAVREGRPHHDRAGLRIHAVRILMRRLAY